MQELEEFDNQGSTLSTLCDELTIDDWIFPEPENYGHNRGATQMTIIVAYDIRDPNRLRLVAKCCEDWGYRVQYSIFECRLRTSQLEAFWDEIKDLIKPEEDRVVAYPIHGAMQDQIRTLGTMQCIEKTAIYIY